VAKTHYDILGVRPTASIAEIRKSYRLLARKYHPDGSSDQSSEAMFHKVSEAYSVLSNEARRTDYDKAIGVGIKGSPSKSSKSFVFERGFNPNESETDDSSESVSEQVSHDKQKKKSDSSVLERVTKLFTRPGQKETPQRAEDLRGERYYHFTIDALESIAGTFRELAIREGGTPRVLKVRIPPGVGDEEMLRVKVSKEGEPEEKLPVKVSIAPHEFVEREGLNVIYKVPITFAEALAGVDLELPTSDEPVKVKIPPRWDIEKRLRARGRGLRRGDQLGDLYIELVVIPPDLEVPGAREIEKALAEAYSVSPRVRFPKTIKKN
jgi:DnaJ-class molecular chaperone